ncbi:AraC family transcriptional regulator [Flavobacterium sp. Fl-318]|uniref:AraC family transcriptional regulator n=1 Tax=Flavobacterium cupriresistens TaxID=2893885 RepID=A0ABU4RH81_9FLAO|nr:MULTISPECIES: AraC family transcriptional regulator [unclassified Flavobacterium]MDX6191248.1 AraC family transcriptional regulator [Flavobacterium sp. Fl-318]UFH42433.1 AraC family transcriptional regulator [Flavobacterium sp. F-323]
MDIIRIPDELLAESSQSVQVFDYNSTQEISKQQIILDQNIFSFLVEGTKEIVLDNSSLSITNSKFLIMKSGHCLMTEKLSETKNYKSVLLFFSNDILLKFIRKFKLNSIEPTDYKPVFSFEYDAFIKRFVNSLLDISKLSKNTQRVLLEVKFEEIMLYLIETRGIDFLLSLTLNNSVPAQKIIRIVESNQLSKLTLNELAFLCDMSISTFKREFEKQYSESPSKWFQNKRLEYAHSLLNQEQRNSSEIYFEVGYENLSSFIQAYKSKYGVTPKHHQKI